MHPATRGIAAGKHYTSPKALPALAGADAVVRRADGSLGYVMVMGAGTLAERIVIDPAAVIPVPAGADPALLVATMNPALSSWCALRTRVPFRAGQSVLVHGATGNAGSMAVKVAKKGDEGKVGSALARLIEEDLESITADYEASPGTYVENREASREMLAEACRVEWIE